MHAGGVADSKGDLELVCASRFNQRAVAEDGLVSKSWLRVSQELLDLIHCLDVVSLLLEGIDVSNDAVDEAALSEVDEAVDVGRLSVFRMSQFGEVESNVRNTRRYAFFEFLAILKVGVIGAHQLFELCQRVQ